MEEQIEEIYDQKEDLRDDLVTVFSVAKKEYKSLVEYLKANVLTGRVDFEMGCKNTEFDLKQGLRDLDIILQYSIVELGFKRGKIEDSNIETIEGVCEHGLLVNELRYKDPYFAWINFNEKDIKYSEEILKSLSVFISEVSRDFAKFFVFANPSIEEWNFRKTVEQKMNNIINVIDSQNMNLIGSENRPACLANAIFRQYI